MCGRGSSAAGEIKKQDLQRQQNIATGMANIDQAFAGFTPGFFEGVRNNTLASLMPQLATSYRATKGSLVTDLATRGLTKSSAARNLANSLASETERNRIAVSDQATQTAQDMQQRVQSEKANVTNQLIASQDPSLAAQQAVSAASSLSAPSTIAPLGNLFQNWANTFLASKIAQTPNNSGGPGFSYLGRTSPAPIGANYYR